ncbi:hypothetical protein DYB36_008472 [Aphanomyces astaci]|uniref:Crinkler effector protein N-terminal domain-containing protein n=1 Tax=Aphanomyces astaci TaxID=112090 RepID=A0A397AX63_APHAT|nr:hypothetical protein DYB36_008472 [Aphanomyces astaci]
MATNGAGFSTMDAQAVTLHRLHGDLEANLRAFKKMDPLHSIKKVFGGTFPPNKEQVYVFVVVPKHAVAAPTRRLFCVVVGRDGGPFSVTVPEDEVVDGLKEQIAIKKKYQFPADEMDLYMATNGAGFSSAGASAVTPYDLYDLRTFTKMNPLLSIKKLFGGPFPLTEELVYVFAVTVEPEKVDVIPRKEHKIDQSYLAISDMSTATVFELGYRLELNGVPAIEASATLSIPDFEWIEKLDKWDPINIQKYQQYVAGMLRDFLKLAVKTTVPYDLDARLSKCHRELKGASDLYVIPRACGDFLGRNDVVVLMELTQSENLSQRDVARTAGCMLAANTIFNKLTCRPTPVGVATNLRDEWLLFWVGPRGQICMASVDSNNEKLSRETAWHYIRKHCEYVNSIYESRFTKRETVIDESKSPTPHPVFGGINAGFLTK